MDVEKTMSKGMGLHNSQCPGGGGDSRPVDIHLCDKWLSHLQAKY